MAEQQTPLNEFFGGSGTSRKTRLLAALRPDYVKVEERDVVQLIRQAKSLARRLKYFGESQTEEADWSAFLEGDEEEIAHFLEDPHAFEDSPEKYARYTRPHFALFLTFLKLLQHPQNQLNQLTERHLEFYFQQYLGLRRKTPQPFQVHVFFELAAAAQQYRLPQGTELDAGEDQDGQTIIYRTDQEVTINRARITSIKSIHLTKDGIFAAEDATRLSANVQSGRGRWKTFGSTLNDSNPNLSYARLGMAIANPKLAIDKLNVRYIHLRFTLEEMTKNTRMVDFKRMRYFASTRNDMKAIDRDIHFHPRFLLRSGYTTISCVYNRSGGEVTAELGGFSESDVGKLLIKDHHVVWITEFETTNRVLVTPFFSLVTMSLDHREANYEEATNTVNRIDGRTFSTKDTGKLLILDATHYWIDKVLTSETAKVIALKDAYNSRNGIKVSHYSLHIILDVLINLSASVPAIEPLSPIKRETYSKGTLFHHLDSGYPCIQILQPAEKNTAGVGSAAELSYRDFEIHTIGERPILIEEIIEQDGIEETSTKEVTEMFSLNQATQRFGEREGELEIYHLHPFGYHLLADLPDFIAFAPTYQREGELYIGIEGLQVPQTLNFLFQMAEGSANTVVTPQNLNWSFLQQDEWITPGVDDKSRSKKLPPLLLADGTAGLMNSGIVGLNFSIETNQNNHLLPTGFSWLRISVASGGEGVSDTIAVHAQAVSASLKLNENEASSLPRPLAPDTISDLLHFLPAIAKVHQPYSSLESIPSEVDETFYARISERIRHKNRALVAWDYERLVLENFPDAFKVKCLPAKLIDEDTPVAAAVDPVPDKRGLVELIVVPKIKGEQSLGTYEPRLASDKVVEIEKFLSRYTSPFTRLKVFNPKYERVQLSFDVRFQAGLDQGYYKKVLNDTINRFLSPWVEDKEAEIEFDRTIYAHTFVNLIDEQPYVNFVANLRMAELTSEGIELKPYLKAKHSNSVWVTAAEHLISSLETDEIPDGIGNMQVKWSFQVNIP